MPDKKSSDKDPICFCFEVPEEEIVKAIHEHKIRSLEECKKHCAASTGCGTCAPDVEAIIARENGEEPPAKSPKKSKKK
jgi:NAD(P)H-nitrite reductase large subunit